MTPTLDAKVHDFLALKRIAVAGVSRANNHHSPASLVYHRLKKTGHDVFAVNPRMNNRRTQGAGAVLVLAAAAVLLAIPGPHAARIQARAVTPTAAAGRPVDVPVADPVLEWNVNMLPRAASSRTARNKPNPSRTGIITSASSSAGRKRRVASSASLPSETACTS